MNAIALDIGGANLKAADGAHFSLSRSFPLWKNPAGLPQALHSLLKDSPPADRLLVTMTGELADCFERKSDGVRAILDAVKQAADDRQIDVYLCDGRLVPLEEAHLQPLLAAASNWHALASYVARSRDRETGILIDIGSTTTDIIPFVNGKPVAVGQSDPQRLVTGELVYTGVQRSPVAALVSSLSWRGEECGVAQEVFATTGDVYLLLGEVSQQPQNTNTADGRPSTTVAAHARLARMICGDVTMVSLDDAKRAALKIRDAQLRLLSKATQQVLSRLEISPETVVISGQGEFLARRLLQHLSFERSPLSLSATLGPGISQCACAHALAVLQRERMLE